MYQRRGLSNLGTVLRGLLGSKFRSVTLHSFEGMRFSDFILLLAKTSEIDTFSGSQKAVSAR